MSSSFQTPHKGNMVGEVMYRCDKCGALLKQWNNVLAHDCPERRRSLACQHLSVM